MLSEHDLTLWGRPKVQVLGVVDFKRGLIYCYSCFAALVKVRCMCREDAPCELVASPTLGKTSVAKYE